jgi:hypothetical protein
MSVEGIKSNALAGNGGKIFDELVQSQLEQHRRRSSQVVKLEEPLSTLEELRPFVKVRQSRPYSPPPSHIPHPLPDTFSQKLKKALFWLATTI